MHCPFCGCMENKVIDSRAAEEGSSIRRRRECLECLRRFTTYEIIEQTPLMITKKDRSRVPFDPNKLLIGILKACEKRQIPLRQVEALVEKVEKDLRSTIEGEISTAQIGEMAMKQLKEFDEVAYVRFASVYRQFSDIDNFMQELQLLMKDKSE